MKLRNKKTGEIRDFIINKDKIQTASTIKCWEYDSLSELNEDWEDVPEEPKEYWYINSDSVIYATDCGKYPDSDLLREEIGNYFETEEEAEKAVEKLKAWKRLRDKGFRFMDWNCALKELYFDVPDTFYDGSDMVGDAISEETTKDLDLLFGGEE